MKIEHWHCQANYSAEQLDYSNLLGACLGNEGSPRRDQHCDSRKGDRDLSRNPANPLHPVEDLIKFEGGGRIASSDRSFDAELNDVLNLNVAFLVAQRRATLDAFQGALAKRGSCREQSCRSGSGSGTGSRRPATFESSVKSSFTGYGSDCRGRSERPDVASCCRSMPLVEHVPRSDHAHDRLTRVLRVQAATKLAVVIYDIGVPERARVVALTQRASFVRGPSGFNYMTGVAGPQHHNLNALNSWVPRSGPDAKLPSRGCGVFRRFEQLVGHPKAETVPDS
jgi:hypothetical protein